MLLLHPSITQNRGLSALAPHAADDVEIRLAARRRRPGAEPAEPSSTRAPPDVLHGDVLLAEVHGDTVAALSLDDDLLVTTRSTTQADRAAAGPARPPAPGREGAGIVLAGAATFTVGGEEIAAPTAPWSSWRTRRWSAAVAEARNDGARDRRGAGRIFTPSPWETDLLAAG